MLKITKKRFTDLETITIVKWFRHMGIESSWANIYMFTESNISIIRHLVKLYNDNNCTRMIPSDIKGLENVIVINHDATTDTLILRDYYSNLSTNQYNFVQVIGLSGKLYSRNYHHVRGNHNYDGYKVVQHDVMRDDTLRIIINDLVAYKLRIYVQTGPSKGNLQREEFFANKSEMDKRATELFNPNQYGYNATAWELGAEGEYTRLLGY